MNKFWNRDRKAGFLVYPIGDALAQAFLGSFDIARFCVLGIAGALLYASEIPWLFHFIERRWSNPWIRTTAAIVYFNPLWIARHFLIIWLVQMPQSFSTWLGVKVMVQDAVVLGLKSFTGAVVLSIVGNYIIQNRIALNHRFIASAVFSGIMATYYALTIVLK